MAKEIAAARDVPEASDEGAFMAAVGEGVEPAVIRNFAGNWRLVSLAAQGDAAVINYLQENDSGLSVYTAVGQADIQGRLGFSEQFDGLNFQGRQTPIADVLPHLPHAAARGIAIAVQAAPARSLLKNWNEDNPMHLLPERIAPTMWLSTPSKVAPHSDIHDNIACVAVGKRQFTLFPPEQLENLYLGPIMGAPGGVPVSSANLWAPDFARYPRLQQALSSARSATLEPGDAIFIPALWWHAVESLEPLNILVNYWWGGTATEQLSPFNALTHAALAISQLPMEKRQRWQHYFNALVFRLREEPGAHLPPEIRDLITTPSEAQCRDLLQHLARELGEPL